MLRGLHVQGRTCGVGGVVDKSATGSGCMRRVAVYACDVVIAVNGLRGVVASRAGCTACCGGRKDPDRVAELWEVVVVTNGRSICEMSQ